MNKPFHMPGPTFLGITEADSKRNAPDQAYFQMLPVPYEATVSYRGGTRDGPRAILDASLHVELFDEEFRFEPWKEAGIHTLPSFASPEPPEIFIPALSEHIRRIWRPDTFLFTLGGEHSITEGPLAVAAERCPGLSVLQIDAHADLRDEYQGSRFNHACAARRMMEYCAVVQVGIRSVSEDEVQYCNSERVRTFFRYEYRDVRTLIPKVLESLSENVYITIDVDGLDPSVIPGTGTPVPGGLGWYETLDILRAVCRSKNVVSADLTELAPIAGTTVSEFASARLVYKLVTYVTARRGGRLRNEPFSRLSGVR